MASVVHTGSEQRKAACWAARLWKKRSARTLLSVLPPTFPNRHLKPSLISTEKPCFGNFSGPFNKLLSYTKEPRQSPPPRQISVTHCCLSRATIATPVLIFRQVVPKKLLLTQEKCNLKLPAPPGHSVCFLH